MKKYKIGVILGSLRKESYNLKTAKALIALEPESLPLELLGIGNLPMFNEDLEATPPMEWVAFREKIAAVDGLIFLTPEYNRSVPRVLKNAIDVGSRPHGQNSWDGKPGAIASVSIGGISGFGANHHLRQSLVFVNVPTMAQGSSISPIKFIVLNHNNVILTTENKDFLKMHSLFYNC